MTHYVSITTAGELCAICWNSAKHKIGEEIAADDPLLGQRHNFTTYLCCSCFRTVFGSAVFCACKHKWGTVNVVAETGVIKHNQTCSDCKAERQLAIYEIVKGPNTTYVTVTDDKRYSINAADLAIAKNLTADDLAAIVARLGHVLLDNGDGQALIRRIFGEEV